MRRRRHNTAVVVIMSVLAGALLVLVPAYGRLFLELPELRQYKTDVEEERFKEMQEQIENAERVRSFEEMRQKGIDPNDTWHKLTLEGIRKAQAAKDDEWLAIEIFRWACATEQCDGAATDPKYFLPEGLRDRWWHAKHVTQLSTDPSDGKTRWRECMVYVHTVKDPTGKVTLHPIMQYFEVK